LSPLLFVIVIVIEMLSRMVTALVNMGLLTSFSVGSRNVGALNISHLLYADDILLFCRENPDHLHNLCCLLCFETVFVTSHIGLYGNGDILICIFVSFLTQSVLKL
jgi:hypothetical protein